MIAAFLYGRLGNQLFQYAAGRALSLRLGVGLCLDTRHYRGKSRNDLAINHFSVVAEQCARLPPFGSGLRRRLGHLRKTPFSIYEQQEHLLLDKEYFNQPDWTYLRGSFQSERYFTDHATAIRQDLRIRSATSAANRRIADAIATTCAVSVHIRRGDYIGNVQLGILTLEYYYAAMRRMNERLAEEPTFFLFSDDPQWVTDNLRPSAPHVVVHQRGPAYEDLRLMSLCKHHIIANSSFSWWGAWLNPSCEKIVIGPKRWTSDPRDTMSERVPSEWLRV